MELIIMAGGLGSRFGGLKQLEPIDSNGNFIIDYSIFDAIRCGFDKVTFIIKKENLEAFRETIGRRIEEKIQTNYIFQDNSNVPTKYIVPESRTKPLGTGHAVLCTKNSVYSNFAVINADDFYGYEAFALMAEFLKSNNQKNHYAMIGYKAINTISENGSVKRGVCEIKNENLKSITESSIEKRDGNLFAKPVSDANASEQKILDDQIVSMNFFGFTLDFLEELESHFFDFLEDNRNNLESVEFFLPSVVSDLINKSKATTKVIPTNASWYGLTYREDKQIIEKAISKMIADKIYPENLWND